MKKSLLCASLLTGTWLALGLSSFATENELAERLKKAIQPEDLVFLYDFNDGKGEESTNSAPPLVIRTPATIDSSAGREGGGLVIHPPFSMEGKGNCAEARGAAGQFPNDALSFDFFFKPDEAFLTEQDNRGAYLVDQMYTEKTGFQCTFNPKTRKLTVRIGNGEKHLAATSKGLGFTPGQWTHLAFTYDSKSGTLAIFENGTEVASTTQADFGPINYGSKPFRIGNRIGSNYGNACGVFDDVRMTRKASLF